MSLPSLYEMENRLKDRLGCDPSEEQLAVSLRISRTDLKLTMIECSLAREKLAMSNVRLVMSIAQRYDNMGAEMADLIQVKWISHNQSVKKWLYFTSTKYNADLKWISF